MVLVPRNELLDRLAMHELRGGTDRLLGIGRPRAAEEEAATHAEVEPDRSRLIDHDDALAVGMVQHLLGIGVVRGTERVGPDPGEQREVVDHCGIVVTAAVDVQVLVLPEAPEVEGLAVDEEAGALDPHGADADRERVAVDDVVVVNQLDLEVVEVATARAPELRSRHAQRTVGALRRGDHDAPGVPKSHADGRCAGVGDLHFVADDAGPLVNVGHHRDVVDAGAWRRGQPDAAVEAGVVEEVVVLALPPRPVGQSLHHARRDRLPRQLVVDDDREPALLARCHRGGHVRLEGRVAALVLGDEGVTDPHRGAVGRRVESQHDPLSGPAPGNEDVPLVPDVADMIVQLGIHQDVVEAARNRHASGVGQGGPPPALGPAHSGGVGREAPDAVESLGLARDGVLWSQHRVSRCVGQVSAGLLPSSPSTTSAMASGASSSVSRIAVATCRYSSDRMAAMAAKVSAGSSPRRGR